MPGTVVKEEQPIKKEPKSSNNNHEIPDKHKTEQEKILSKIMSSMQNDKKREKKRKKKHKKSKNRAESGGNDDTDDLLSDHIAS